MEQAEAQSPENEENTPYTVVVQIPNPYGDSAGIVRLVDIELQLDNIQCIIFRSNLCLWIQPRKRTNSQNDTAISGGELSRGCLLHHTFCRKLMI